MAFVVGITGGIGSGKSALTDYLATRGVTIVDADVAARVVVEPGRPALAAIVRRFGDQILNPDGSLDRAALRKIVFENPAERVWLESVTHPAIREEIREQLVAADSVYVVLSSPLLLESGQHEFVDHVVVVDVSEAVQLARTMARDNNDAALVEKIMSAQLPRQKRLARADTIIDNGGSLEALHRQAEGLHANLSRLASHA